MTSPTEDITYLEFLPNDIIYNELARLISKADLFCVELVIGKRQLPSAQYFPADIHEQIVREGLNRYRYFDKCKVFDRTESMNLAAKYGQLEIMQYGLNRGVIFNNRALSNAAEYGHLKCIKLLLQKAVLRCNKNTLHAAVKGGHLGCVTYIMRKHKGMDYDIINVAARYGHLEIFKMLIAPIGKFGIINCVRDATIGGHIHIIEFIAASTIGRFDATRFYGEAIIHKQYHVLTYFLSNHAHNDSGYYVAIGYGDVTALQCFFDNGVPIRPDVRTKGLASTNNPEVISWFNDH
jgi:hypothetical protein